MFVGVNSKRGIAYVCSQICSKSKKIVGGHLELQK